MKTEKKQVEINNQHLSLWTDAESKERARECQHQAVLPANGHFRVYLCQYLMLASPLLINNSSADQLFAWGYSNRHTGLFLADVA